MKPDPRFRNLPKDFWANVRLISQEVGYTVRGLQEIKVPSLGEIQEAFAEMSLDAGHLVDPAGSPTPYGKLLLDYFVYRATMLHQHVEPMLMTAEQAKKVFERLRKKLRPKSRIPLNRQSGEKKAPAFFTGIINMLIEANAKNMRCDYDPRVLTTITRDGKPLRTLARRIDGAFPCVIDPVAVWEIKEYYYTTTFGSRVADGVYESLLDGLELEELRISEGVDVKHYLMIDAHYTWWSCGRSYLCRIFDMLHMGYVDEVLCGQEVLERLPLLVKEWISEFKDRQSRGMKRP
ncbi:MAG: hypothetical protein FJ280_05275 [Planctomycetes bacterium]|nr:hypothetical protein [Planctomycetota bacterium]